MEGNKIETKLVGFKPLKDLVKANFQELGLEIKCIIFKSADDLNLIVYADQNKSIICYDINNNQKVNEVHNAHEKEISFLNYYSKKMKGINLMLSISAIENNLKVWNASTFKCLHNFTHISSQGWINCACFLNDNNQMYVLSTNSTGYSKTPNPIKVYDLKGNNIKDINNSSQNTYFIDVYYDNKASKKYIITGNIGFSQSYNYDTNTVYHTYDDKDIKFHTSSIIKEGETVELIESSQDGNIRIWNFHTADLLKKINVGFSGSFVTCLWDNDYLLACSKDGIKIIYLKDEKNITESKLGSNGLIRIGKIAHSKYGKCLVLQTVNGFSLYECEN